MFLLPQAILKKIEEVCRAYLWSGKAKEDKGGHAKWSNVCKPKKYGGLGFRQIQKWNIAAIGKLVWHIGANKDDLWVKRVHNVYIKEQDWIDYKAASTASWVMKYLCQVKDILRNKNLLDWSGNTYQINKVYKMLTGEDTRPVAWVKGV